jgi:hypothetical protein
MNRCMRHSLPVMLATLLWLGTLIFWSAPLTAAESGDSSTDTNQVESVMAGLTDEQVRQLLIEELQEDAAAEAPVPMRMKGPAYVLSSMLSGLSSEHNENEDQLEALFAGIPHVLPDLNKVFLRL